MWVKICGITRTADATHAVCAGADALGLNFHPASKRFVRIDDAERISEAVRQTKSRPPVDLVGVFVDADPLIVVETAHRLNLSAVQFHGDESPEVLRQVHQELPAVKLIRAVRLSEHRLNECRRSVLRTSGEVPLAAVLVDTFIDGEFGGTGRTLPKGIVQRFSDGLEIRLILAGGLTPENITSRITAERPWGVDTASGVETAPGIKAADSVSQFIRRVRQITVVEPSGAAEQKRASRL